MYIGITIYPYYQYYGETVHHGPGAGRGDETMGKNWKVDSDQPIDGGLRDAILDKIDAGSLELSDLRDYFTVFTQICNNTEEIRDEVERFDRCFQFVIDAKPTAWLDIREKKFETGSGKHDHPDIILEMDTRLALGMFSGRIDPTAAYMNGELRVTGVINDAIQFRTILELVQEELE